MASRAARTARRPAGVPVRSPGKTTARAVSRVKRLVITREADQSHHDVVVEGPSRLFHDVLDGRVMRQRLAIGARGRQRIVDVGNRDNACAQWDPGSPKSVGIAAAIPALVVMTDDDRTLSE